MTTKDLLAIVACMIIVAWIMCLTVTHNMVASEQARLNLAQQQHNALVRQAISKLAKQDSVLEQRIQTISYYHGLLDEAPPAVRQLMAVDSGWEAE